MARAVVLAIGYYDRPNLIGVPGEDLLMCSNVYEEAHPYYLQRVGSSAEVLAAETALELYAPGPRSRSFTGHAELKATIKYWVRPDIENRIKEGLFVALVQHAGPRDSPTDVVLEGPAGREELRLIQCCF